MGSVLGMRSWGQHCRAGGQAEVGAAAAAATLTPPSPAGAPAPPAPYPHSSLESERTYLSCRPPPSGLYPHPSGCAPASTVFRAPRSPPGREPAAAAIAPAPASACQQTCLPPPLPPLVRRQSPPPSSLAHLLEIRLSHSPRLLGHCDHVAENAMSRLCHPAGRHSPQRMS